MLIEKQELPLSVGHLAEEITAIEQDKEMITPLSAQDRKQTYIALVQHHLDKLDEVGVVAYHTHSKKVYATDGLVDLVRHLESVCEAEVREE